MPGRAFALLAACLAAAGFAAEPASAASAPYRAPRTADGRPDMQGVWTNTTYTPLQRPKRFSALNATDAEAAAYVAESRDRRMGKPPAPKPGDPPPEPSVGAEESEWYEGLEGLLRIDGRTRTSLIVEPGDGRLPYNLYGRRAVENAVVRDDTAMENPEDRLGDERCLMPHSATLGPPMLPSSQNGHYRILQTPGLVAIHTEMIHDVRLVRMGAAHEAGPARWMGDSVGRWEGETLVVETTGQHPLTAERFLGSGVLILTPNAKVTERLTRVSATELRYAFEVEDAAVYTRPWRGELTFRATDALMYEYACHEGNYALANILGGARRREADLKAAADKNKPAPGAAKAKAD